VGALPRDQQVPVACSPYFVRESHSATPEAIKASHHYYFVIVSRWLMEARRDICNGQGDSLRLHFGIGVADAAGEGAAPLLKPGDIRRMVHDPHGIRLMVANAKPGLDH
jgi:hypothetical protein